VRPEDAQASIGQVLEDLLDTHTGLLGQPGDADLVVQCLNVPTPPIDEDTTPNGGGGDDNGRSLDEDEVLKSAKMAAFSKLTGPQAAAICKWLAHARSWPELKWYTNEIDSAVAYWAARAGGQ
jgi:hypothetical protein